LDSTQRVDHLRRLATLLREFTLVGLVGLMHVALADLKLERLDVLHAGEDTFRLAPKTRAVAARCMLQDVRPLR